MSYVTASPNRSLGMYMVVDFDNNYYFKTYAGAHAFNNILLNDYEKHGPKLDLSPGVPIYESHLQYQFKMPGYSDWTCDLFGMGPNGFVLSVEEGHVPNWFWRKMQYLFFGNVWRKRGSTE